MTWPLTGTTACSTTPTHANSSFGSMWRPGASPFARYLVEFEGYTEDEAAQIVAEASAGADTLTFAPLPPGDA